MKRGERTTINGISLMSLNGSNHRRVRDFFLSFFPFSLFFFSNAARKEQTFFSHRQIFDQLFCSTSCFPFTFISDVLFLSEILSLSFSLSLCFFFSFFFNLYKHVVELHGINGKETERNSKNLVKFTLVSCYKN